jgi:hypothetical protein
MSNNDMDHMKFLTQIAENDVKVLEVKEGTYKGSWKAAGGRSAWFMARRNADRLINMMAPPPEPKIGYNPQNMLDFAENLDRAGFDDKSIHVRGHAAPMIYAAMIRYMVEAGRAEDIFAKIDEHPSGEDGTVLAVVRDLRRYLLLVEAEMVSRWDKEKKHAERLAAELADIAKRGVSNTGKRKPTIEELEKILKEPDKPVVISEDGSVSEMKSARRVPRYNFGVETTRDDEINTEHVNDIDYLEPWVVSPNYFKMYKISVENREKFWNLRAPAVHLLDAHVVSPELPRVLHGFYVMNSDHSWTLDVRRVPPEIRFYLPDLASEKNMKEHEELPEWQRWLYVWDKDGQKYRLSSNNLAWHVEK